MNEVIAEIEISDVKVKLYTVANEIDIRNIITAVKSC